MFFSPNGSRQFDGSLKAASRLNLRLLANFNLSSEGIFRLGQNCEELQGRVCMKGRMEKPRDKEDAFAGLKWPVGEFYVPGLWSDQRISRVSGAADTHRRVFLVRAATLEPDLLTTLRAIDESENELKAWAARWHLTDRWCTRLAEEVNDRVITNGNYRPSDCREQLKMSAP
jgi:hypothetical protein